MTTTLLSECSRETPTETHSDSGVSDAACTQILTVNLEDYFQAGVFRKYISHRNWPRFESRLEKNTDGILELLRRHNTQATFFVLGWIADTYPELVRRIAAEGHEIASRGYLHQPLLRISPTARREDLTRSRKVLEDTVGLPVRGFRLSDGWIRRSDFWFLSELIEAGYQYDSSLLPRHRDFLLEPWRRFIHEHECDAGRIVQIPLTTIPIAGAWIPIAGGNYLRQLPRAITDSAIRNWQRSEQSPFVMYFQVWELDDGQPRFSVTGRFDNVRHYRKLGRYWQLLPQYLRTTPFTSIDRHSRLRGSPLNCLPACPPRVIPSHVVPGATTERLSAGNSAAAADVGTITTFRPDSAQRTAVTLVIPCYNEESTLPYLHRTMVSLRHELSRQWDLKLIFVDDRSQDNTFDLLTTLFGEDPHVRILRHETNLGVSAGILTGIRAADTDVVASIDADCSYDPHELIHMLPLMRDGVAMVTASPYHRLGQVSNVPGWRLLLSHTLSCIYRLVLRKKLATWTSCFRVYRRQQILDLPLVENGFLGTAELAAQLSLHERTIVEHPATLEVRLFGFSKMKTVRTILAHLRLLWKVVRQRTSGFIDNAVC